MHTADVAQRRLRRFCELSGVAHSALRSMPQKQLEDLAQDVVRGCEQRGYAPDYTAGILKGLKSWLKHNDRELKRDIKIKDLGVPVTLEEEKVPEPSQLQEILSAATPRAKVSASFMAFSGVRPEVLGNKDGSGGLVLADLPDLDLEKLEFRSMPAQVIIRRELSKVRHEYFTYLNEKGCGYLLANLQGRRAAGEKLAASSPVVGADEDHKRATLKHLERNDGVKREYTPFMCTSNITAEVKRAILRAGSVVGPDHKAPRPYILRAYFDSHLLTAELQGRMTSTSRGFFMGHKGDIERRYTLNKHRLPEQLARDMRRQYEQGSAFLIAEQLTEEQVDAKVESVRSEIRAKVEEESKSEIEELKRNQAVMMEFIAKYNARMKPLPSTEVVDPLVLSSELEQAERRDLTVSKDA